MRIALLAIVATCAATPAFADWQNTQWGMTPDQVAQVVGNVESVNVPDGNGQVLMGKTTTSSGELTFATSFYYRQGRLDAVSMELISGRCMAALNALSGKYGPVQNASGSSFWQGTFRGDADNVEVHAMSGGGTCLLTYKPLRTADAAGL